MEAHCWSVSNSSSSMKPTKFSHRRWGPRSLRTLAPFAWRHSSRASVLVAQCLYRDTPGPAHLSFARMAAHAAAAGVAVELEAAQDARIDVARNVLAAEALRRGAGHILYVDDDVVLPPDALVRLLARDVPVVSGVYYRRRPPSQACPWRTSRSPSTAICSSATLAIHARS